MGLPAAVQELNEQMRALQLQLTTLNRATLQLANDVERGDGTPDSFPRPLISLLEKMQNEITILKIQNIIHHPDMIFYFKAHKTGFSAAQNEIVNEKIQVIVAQLIKYENFSLTIQGHNNVHLLDKVPRLKTRNSELRAKAVARRILEAFLDTTKNTLQQEQASTEQKQAFIKQYLQLANRLSLEHKGSTMRCRPEVSPLNSRVICIVKEEGLPAPDCYIAQFQKETVEKETLGKNRDKLKAVFGGDATSTNWVDLFIAKARRAYLLASQSTRSDSETWRQELETEEAAINTQAAHLGLDSEEPQNVPMANPPDGEQSNLNATSEI